MSNSKTPKSRTTVEVLAEIGDRIREARGDIPCTVLAFRLGVSWSLVHKWESGLAAPKLVDLLELCRVLDRSVNYFLEGVDGPSLSQTLLKLGYVTEEQLLRAKGEMFQIRHGKHDVLDRENTPTVEVS